MLYWRRSDGERGGGDGCRNASSLGKQRVSKRMRWRLGLGMAAIYTIDLDYLRLWRPSVYVTISWR